MGVCVFVCVRGKRWREGEGFGGRGGERRKRGKGMKEWKREGGGARKGEREGGRKRDLGVK